MSDNQYPSNWNTLRKKVYRKNDYTCQNCGRRAGELGDAELHAHHIVPKAQGGTHELNNLTTLCDECHSAVHGKTMAPTASGTESSSSGEDGFKLLLFFLSPVLFILVLTILAWPWMVFQEWGERYPFLVGAINVVWLIILAKSLDLITPEYEEYPP